MATKFKPAGEQLADSIAGTGGTLTPLVPGEVRRVGHTTVHDMSAAWAGRELTWSKPRYSLWDKSIVLSLGWSSTDGEDYMEFTVKLQPPMTKEEIDNAAFTYMMALNMRRST